MNRIPEEYRALSGSQKAAVLMLALSEDQCSRLFGMMHEDEIKEISAAMAQLGPVRSEVVERLQGRVAAPRTWSCSRGRFRRRAQPWPDATCRTMLASVSSRPFSIAGASSCSVCRRTVTVLAEESPTTSSSPW